MGTLLTSFNSEYASDTAFPSLPLVVMRKPFMPLSRLLASPYLYNGCTTDTTYNQMCVLNMYCITSRPRLPGDNYYFVHRSIHTQTRHIQL